MTGTFDKSGAPRLVHIPVANAAKNGADLVVKLNGILSKAIFGLAGYCYRHDDFCRFASARSAGGPLHLEFAGVTFVTWNKMNRGDRLGWFHPSAAVACSMLIG